MSDADIEAARQWIRRLQGELAELEADANFPERLAVAEGIREEIARVERLIASGARGREQVLV